MRLAALLAIPLLIGAAPAQDVSPTPSAPPAAADDDGGRIVGGVPAEFTPWQVQIYTTYKYTDIDEANDRQAVGTARQFLETKPDWERQHRCGGVYIGDNWILTAAHCIVKVTGNVLEARRVRLGTQNLTLPGTTWRIERAVWNKDYVDEEPYPNDIALIRIAPDPGATTRIDPAKTISIRPIGSKPDDRALAEADRVRVTGWGLTKARNSGHRSRTGPAAATALPSLRS